MIKSFEDKALHRFFETGNPKGLKVQNDKRIARLLRALDAAVQPEDMNLPGLKFHRLIGEKKGRFAVLVSGNWRLTFGWQGEDAVEVDLEDYH